MPFKSEFRRKYVFFSNSDRELLFYLSEIKTYLTILQTVCGKLIGEILDMETIHANLLQLKNSSGRFLFFFCFVLTIWNNNELMLHIGRCLSLMGNDARKDLVVTSKLIYFLN